MFSQDELVSLHGFLKSTGEGNLKKMMVNGKMTDAHLRILLKVVRGCGETEFAELLSSGNLPKLKLSPQESALKEHFWPVCIEAFQGVGLLSKQPAAKKAA